MGDGSSSTPSARPVAISDGVLILNRKVQWLSIKGKATSAPDPSALKKVQQDTRWQDLTIERSENWSLHEEIMNDPKLQEAFRSASVSRHAAMSRHVVKLIQDSVLSRMLAPIDEEIRTLDPIPISVPAYAGKRQNTITYNNINFKGQVDTLPQGPSPFLPRDRCELPEMHQPADTDGKSAEKAGKKTKRNKKKHLLVVPN